VRGGEIGFTELAQAEPDGYTIGFINTPHLVTHPISRETRYQLADIQPVSNVVYDPGAFSVLPDAPFTTLDELVAYAKENPGVITYGTTGAGGDDHLAAVALERQADIQLTHVPFSGAANVRAAVLGGHITMASMNVTEALSDAQAGSLVILGQMAEERWPGAPDIPTFKEQGYDVIMGSNRGIGASAGIPSEVLDALENAVAKAVEDPEFVEAAQKQQLALSYQDAASFKASLEPGRTR
jgi:tripartite-type tricarboxylate transporter receptor subunit TctC